MKSIVRILCGSHLYGTSLPTSDKDYKEVFIPDGRDILLQRANRVDSKVTEQVDTEKFPIQSFLKLLCEGQTVAMDLVFAPSEFYDGAPSREWLEIIQNRDEFVSRQCKAFVGYCRQQASKYAVKADRMAALQMVVDLLQRFMEEKENFRRRVENGEKVGLTVLDELFQLVESAQNPFIKWVYTDGPQGKKIQHISVCETLVPLTASTATALETYRNRLSQYGERAKIAQNMGSKDWKALYHAVRVAEEALELLKTGRITFPRPEREFLLEIRQGKVPHETISTLLEQNLIKLDEAVEKSHLPEKPNFALAEKMVENLHLSEVYNENWALFG